MGCFRGLLPLPCLLLVGCVSFDIDESLSVANQELPEFTAGNLQLQVNEEQKASARKRINELLDARLEPSPAIEVALLNSPAVQAMLAEHWAKSSDTALSGSIPNPVFEFSRVSSDAELEIERMLAIGLLDLIRLPVLMQRAEMQLAVNQLSLASSVVDLVTDVRQAWIDAVVTKQLEAYAQQVFSSAGASVKLAANMEAIGNFNALSRATQQAYYADAATNLATARHAALAAREALVRLLGLDPQQAPMLRLPDRLPELPESPLSPDEVSSVATSSRLDVRMALTGLQLATMQQGIRLLGEVTDVEIAGISETVWNEEERESSTGYELAIELPIFRRIDQVRDRMNAQSLMASSALENVTRSANSHLKESYSAYRSGYDIARHYRDEVVPLQQLITEENVLNYNGMIIGIFELLNSSRAQIEAVQSSIQAAGQFWMADAALRSSMVGKPSSMALAMSAGAGGGGGGGGEH